MGCFAFPASFIGLATLVLRFLGGVASTLQHHSAMSRQGIPECYGQQAKLANANELAFGNVLAPRFQKWSGGRTYCKIL